jgi:cell wall-associated NlpC family hydrolase
MKLPDDLQPGDILLYATPGDFIDEVIEIFSDGVAHIEIYHGGGESVASRNGIGVNLYPYRSEGLLYVRRPLGTFQMALADAWFNAGIRGLPYGWAGLLDPVGVDLPSRGLICSTFADFYLSHGGLPQFADDFPAGKAKPGDFRLVRSALTLWSSDPTAPAPNV